MLLYAGCIRYGHQHVLGLHALALSQPGHRFDLAVAQQQLLVTISRPMWSLGRSAALNSNFRMQHQAASDVQM